MICSLTFHLFCLHHLHKESLYEICMYVKIENIKRVMDVYLIKT